MQRQTVSPSGFKERIVTYGAVGRENDFLFAAIPQVGHGFYDVRNYIAGSFYQYSISES